MFRCFQLFEGRSQPFFLQCPVEGWSYKSYCQSTWVTGEPAVGSAESKIQWITNRTSHRVVFISKGTRKSNKLNQYLNHNLSKEEPVWCKVDTFINSQRSKKKKNQHFLKCVEKIHNLPWNFLLEQSFWNFDVNQSQLGSLLKVSLSSPLPDGLIYEVSNQICTPLVKNLLEFLNSYCEYFFQLCLTNWYATDPHSL